MLAMKAAIVPELAWQMGRPVRFGAGELRGFEAVSYTHLTLPTILLV